MDRSIICRVGLKNDLHCLLNRVFCDGSTGFLKKIPDEYITPVYLDPPSILQPGSL